MTTTSPYLAPHPPQELSAVRKPPEHGLAVLPNSDKGQCGRTQERPLRDRSSGRKERTGRFLTEPGVFWGDAYRPCDALVGDFGDGDLVSVRGPRIRARLVKTFDPPKSPGVLAIHLPFAVRGIGH